MQDTLILRSRIIKAMRDYCALHNSIDVETPILGRSTPEELVIILSPAEFIAITSSLSLNRPSFINKSDCPRATTGMVQVARCFRDEDLRADRQPEFNTARH